MRDKSWFTSNLAGLWIGEYYLFNERYGSVSGDKYWFYVNLYTNPNIKGAVRYVETLLDGSPIWIIPEVCLIRNGGPIASSFEQDNHINATKIAQSLFIIELKDPCLINNLPEVLDSWSIEAIREIDLYINSLTVGPKDNYNDSLILKLK
jgi:hypothetical protein